jgi:hypothetical protein
MAIEKFEITGSSYSLIREDYSKKDESGDSF